MPHVTLVRKAQCVPLPDAMMPIAWQVNEFSLIRSELAPGGSRHRVLRTWPLE
jgi:2'-5' RNA ligase